MGMTDWENVTNYIDTVGTILKTFSFAKPQDYVKVTTKGTANVTYTIGTKTGTLTPGQSVEVSEVISSFTLTAASGTQTIEVFAKEDGTEKTEDNSHDAMSKLEHFPKDMQICDKAFTFGTVGSEYSDGIETEATFKIKYTVQKKCYDIRLLFGNYTVKTTGDLANTTSITIGASIEYNGVIYPLRFHSNKQITIDGESFAISDTLGLEMQKADVFYVRSYVKVDAGNKYPLSVFLSPSEGEGKSSGDLTLSGSISTAAVYAYAPLSIIGKTTDYSPSVLVVGDSIAAGVGDSPLNMGFIVRGIKSNYSYGSLTRAGDNAYTFQALTRHLRMRQSDYYTHAVVEYGINDLANNRTLAEIQTSLLNIWNAFKLRGLKVYQTTIVPQTTSTDSWTTVENQTSFSKESIRLALNAWIRTCPAPLNGYFEAADLVETKRDSGKWKAGYTSDGVHPNTTGHLAMVPCIDTTKF